MYMCVQCTYSQCAQSCHIDGDVTRVQLLEHYGVYSGALLARIRPIVHVLYTICSIYVYSLHRIRCIVVPYGRIGGDITVCIVGTTLRRAQLVQNYVMYDRALYM